MENTVVINKLHEEKLETITKKKQGKELLLFLLSPLMTIIMLEVLRADYFVSYFELGVLSALAKYAITYIFILSVNWFFSKIFVKRLIGIYFVNIALFVFGMATLIAIRITGDPILPADMILTTEVSDLVSFIKIPWKAIIFISFGVLILHLVLYTFFEIKCSSKAKKTWNYRIITFALSIVCFAVMLCSIGYSEFVRKNILEPAGVKLSGYYTISDYKTNGLILTFVPHLRDLVVEKPQGYSKDKIAEIKKKYPDVQREFKTGALAQNANVIAIQSESFWDPTRMENITLSGDPMAKIHRLSRTYPSGYMVSPVFGCNTCVPEFEFLTGSSASFLKAGTYPYTQYIHRDITALPRVFKDNGYKTVALHTYDKYFYNRAQAYSFMGFDEFYGSRDMENPERKGTYISDMEMTRQIIKQYEANKDNPLFVYAITMQNHGNYLNKRYDVYDIDVNSEAVSEDDKVGLRDAVQGIYDIDKSFYELTQYFSVVSEPTIIVIYGDHLPFLGENSSTFYDTGFLKSDNLAENPQIYETPYLIWANFDISGVETPARVSSAYLGVSALRYAGVKKVPWNLAFYNHCFDIHSVYQHSLSTDAAGEYIERKDDDITNDYKYIQYDVISGSDYSKD
ncbi:MAG: sulfatase-like hydrolase/transferase [Clostridia bacterium]|nr:sulfatase-like hydrolase/transferase [Clostridia bacterium]